ncbi:MAG: CIA30 family protein [Synechococcaceae cyanobacterium]|nr:CIA30 family protein [Synechococcaceae cyanobacterium]
MQVVAGDGFSGWHALNDTVMGGRSSGACQATAGGLVLEAEVVEQGGGFVSVRSPLFSPPLDLSPASALRLELVGDGRRYKLAVACADGLAGMTELIPGGLRWVSEFATRPGPCEVVIPFDQLRPSIRARPVQRLPLGLPLRFDASRITRLQILHSKFGDDGGLNPGFRPGPLHLELKAIHADP